VKKRIAIVLAGILVVVLGRGFFYYSGLYSPPPTEMPSYEHIAVPSAANAFDVDELSVLTSRLVSRGLTIDFFDPKDENEGNLKEELKKVNAYIIVCPKTKFPKEEREAVVQFVNNGGKLLLIADPTRPSQINSVSLQFGLIFEDDYLYNMKEYEANYRNIFVTEFKENDITRGIKKVALYTSGSITSADSGIAFVDENTFSSLIETRKGQSPIALAEDSKVLASHDLTFMTEPYNGTLDNNQLISNIADWLATPIEEETEEVEEEAQGAEQPQSP